MKSKLELTWIGKNNEEKVEPRILIKDDERSYGDKNSRNILIHGDNLLALKALEKDYSERIKCIYIDPPYNTGSDSFIYPDKFSESKEEYLRRVGDKNEEGYMTRDGMFRKNAKENGQ